jgi:ADP-heptose:LPS heptosyltransferase
LIGRCQAFLSVDSVLMHLAAAMKVPRQIVIETPTWNKPIAPYNQAFTLVKNPGVAGRNLEFYRYDGRGIRGTREQILECMASVSVDDVYRSLEAALGPAVS